MSNLVHSDSSGGQQASWNLKEDRIIIGGALSVDVLILSQLIGIPDLGLALKVAFFAVAFAIPCTAALLIGIESEIHQSSQLSDRILRELENQLVAFGFMGTLVTITAVFWHFHWAASVVFMGAGGFGWMSYYRRRLISLRPKKQADSND